MERLLDRWSGIWDYSHGYLVLLMSGWLFHSRIAGNFPDHIRPSSTAFLFLIATVMLYALAYMVDSTIAMQVLLPIMIVGALAACGGWQLARLAIVPAAFLYFAIPVWDLTVQPLRDLSTWAVKAMLTMSGIAVYVEGHLLDIGIGRFEISNACSGMTFLVAGLSLSAFYALSWYKSWQDGARLMLLTGAVAVIANWIRIYSLVVVGYRTHMQHYLIVEDHEFYGWVLYGLMMSGVIWFARWQELREGMTPVSSRRVATEFSSSTAILMAGVLAGILMATPILIRSSPETAEAPRQLDWKSNRMGDWLIVAPAPEWTPEAHAPQEILRTGFLKSGSRTIDIYVARYPVQLSDSRVNTRQHQLDHGWQQQARQHLEIQANGITIAVNETELTAPGEQRLMWVWYRVAGHQTSDVTTATIYEILGLLDGRRDGAVLALSAPCDLTCDQARKEMNEFLKNAVNTIHLVADDGPSANL